MQAITYTQYGSPANLNLVDLPQPIPASNQLLVKVKAVSLNAADQMTLSGSPFMARLGSGLFKPKKTILGADVAGIVEAVGADVTHFQPGDEVFVDLSDAGMGGLAEYVCAPASLAVAKPAKVSFAEAATFPLAAGTALQGLQLGGIQAGQTVLVYGASGGVGGFLVQIATALGAEVHAVVSTRNVEYVRTLGATQVVDYKRQDFVDTDIRYDLVMGANGYRTLEEYAAVLKPGGTYVCTGGDMKQIFDAMLKGSGMSRKTGKRFLSLSAKANQADLAEIKTLIEAGKLNARIDKTFPLNAAAEAFRYLADSHAQGKVVIEI